METNQYAQSHDASIISNPDLELAEELIEQVLKLVCPYRVKKGRDCLNQKRLDSMIKSLNSALSKSNAIRTQKKASLFRDKYYASVLDKEGSTIGVCENPTELSTLLHIPIEKAYWIFANRIPGKEKAGPKVYPGYKITLMQSEN